MRTYIVMNGNVPVGKTSNKAEADACVAASQGRYSLLTNPALSQSYINGIPDLQSRQLTQ